MPKSIAQQPVIDPVIQIAVDIEEQLTSVKKNIAELDMQLAVLNDTRDRWLKAEGVLETAISSLRGNQ